MDEFEDQINEAMKCVREGEIYRAESICREILEKQPSHYKGRHVAADISLAKGNLDEAIKSLLQLIGEKADDPAIHLTLATAYKKNNNLNEAIAFFRRLLELEPKSPEALLGLARIYADDGHMDKSFELSEKALSISPKHSGAIKLKNNLKSFLENDCIGPIDEVIPDGIGRGKPQVVYLLRMTGRLGHLWKEPFLLKCLYDPKDYDLIIIIPPKEIIVSMPVFEMTMRDVFIVEVLDPDHHGIFELHHAAIGTHQAGGRTYVLESYTELLNLVCAKMRGGVFPYQYSLTDEDLERGQDLRKAMNIPSEAPIVTLFVREQGYLAQMSQHSVRNSNVMNYIPAVKFLVDEGYYVVRIGDDKMQPLPDLGPRVVDAPFHPAYTQFVDLYFVAESDFMIKTPSGPEAFTIAFDVPGLFLNLPINPRQIALKGDLFVFKKYYSHRYKRNLSLREIGFDKNLLFSNLTEHFTHLQVELLENTEDEILRATKEMVARLKGEHEGNPDYDTRFSEICRQIHEDCSRDIAGNIHYVNDVEYFGLHVTGAQISHEFCDSNPEFLS